jgi:ketosteroid isomerase-like protein
LTGGYGELLRKGYEAWNAGDRSYVLQNFSPDIVWVTPPDDPDQGVFRGHEAVVGFWDAWREAVGQLRFEILELTETSNCVLAEVRRSGVGRQSQLAVSQVVYQVYFFDEDKRCSLVREFYERKRAESAAGTREPPAATA